MVLCTRTLDLEALGYRGAVVEALLVGGCNSSRCSLVGAALGALQGLGGVPAPWIGRVEHGHEICELAQRAAMVSQQ